MNQQTERLIRELAEKLGTTTEYLWGVLVRQATISGVSYVLSIAVWLAAVVLGYWFIRRKTKDVEVDSSRYGRRMEAEWDDEAAFVAWSVWAFVIFVGVVAASANYTSIVSALFNPEFWALKQLLPK